MNENREHEAPVSGLRGLRQDVLPQRDLWPGIQSRLKPVPSKVEGPRRHWAPWVSTALAASLVFGLALNVRQVTPVAEQVAQPVAALSLAGHERALVKANLKIVNDAEKQLLDALKQHPDSRSLKRLLDSNQRQRRELRKLLSKPV